MKTQEYIGDGVYVEFTGHDFILSTERESGTHFIHLEPFMIKRLNDFVQLQKERSNSL